MASAIATCTAITPSPEPCEVFSASGRWVGSCELLRFCDDGLLTIRSTRTRETWQDRAAQDQPQLRIHPLQLAPVLCSMPLYQRQPVSFVGRVDGPPDIQGATALGFPKWQHQPCSRTRLALTGSIEAKVTGGDLQHTRQPGWRTTITPTRNTAG